MTNKIYITCFLSLLFLFTPFFAYANNVVLIEQRIQELDILNKQIVRQSVKLPAQGVLRIKAQVFSVQSGTVFTLILKDFSEVKEGIFPFKNS